MHKRIFSGLALIATFLFFASMTAWSQATTSLHGIVTDPSGAAVPNAKVTLTNTSTGVPRHTVSASNGEYDFASVLPGTFKLTVEASGFHTYVQTGLELEVSLPTTVNVRLEVGEVSQSVEVVGHAPLLNTTNASVGQTMGSSAIENLPIKAENTVLLLSLQPGVVYNGENILTDSYDTRAGSVNGERSDQNNITLDGVSNNNEFTGYAFNGVVPTTPYSVEEFRVTTSNYGASEGRSSGGQIALVTRGGTNQFHGGLYEYNRNTLGEANDYFLKLSQLQNGQPNKPQHLVRNIFGGMLGGPIMKNRFFFFLNIEGHRQSLSQSVERSIPSASLRDGIIQYTCATASQCPGMTVAGVSGKTYTIPSGMYALDATQLTAMDPQGAGPSSVALSYFNTFPIPNDPNYGDAPNFGGYRFAAPTKIGDEWYIGRLDYRLTQNGNHTLFFRGTGVDNRVTDTPFLPGTPPLDTAKDLAKGFVLGYTGVFGPNLVNNFRYGLTRDSYGLNGSTNLPWIQMRDMSQGIVYSNGYTAPVHNIVDTVSWLKGSHNFEFGFNFLLSRLSSWSTDSSFSDALTNADWVDTGGFANTTSPLDPGNGGFPQVASSSNHSYDFPLAAMMGIASEVDAVYNYKITNLTAATPLNQGAPIYRQWAVNDYNLFFQDRWQARPNLSITYGLNYQLMTPMTETNGQQVTPTVNMGQWFNQRATNMLQGIPSNQDALIQFSPSGSYYGRSGLYSSQTRNFAPRIGLAWTPRPSWGWLQRLVGEDKTSIRAGFGMYYDNFGPELALHYSSGGEFGLTSVLTNPAATESVACAPRITSMNTIPKTDNCGTNIFLPAPPSTFPVTYPVGAEAIARGIDQGLKTPYSYAADLSIQRELPGRMTLDIAYVGHFAHRLLVLDDVATPMDLVDPATKVDYFAAAKRFSELARQGTPMSAVTASLVGPTAPYWSNMFVSNGNPYNSCATGATNVLQASYGWYNCFLYNETLSLWEMDVRNRNPVPTTGLNSFYNSQYSSLWNWRSIAWSNYNALQVGLHKQMSNGLLFGLNYTYSHSLDVESMAERGAHYLTDSVINPWNIGQMYASSDFDLRHQFNAYWVAQLPFGRGRMFAKNASGLANAVIGGWQLAGTFRLTSGYPVSVFQGYVWPTNWDEMGWSILTGKPIATGTTTVNGAPNIFKNPTQASLGFDYAYPGQSGTRNPIRGDGYFGWDMNLQKGWNLPGVENQTVNFRWSVFNVTNTPRFDAYSMQSEWDVSSTFGRYTSTLTNPRVMEFALIYQF